MHIVNLDPDFRPLGFNNSYIETERFSFYGGEVHVKLKPTIGIVTSVTLSHRLKSSDAIMQLLLANDALKRKYPGVAIDAVIPYMPAARQDKVMVEGEPFSLGIMANLINSCGFREVAILDAHSDVTPALINNFREFYPQYLLPVKNNIQEEFGDFIVLSPDGGALKKVYKKCEVMKYKGEVYDASKIRDLNTGKIIRTVVNAPREVIAGKTVVILDDICSKGGTFMALSKILKSMGAKDVILVVSHYEGVADLDALRDAGISKVYTTNSIANGNSGNFLKVFPI